MEITTYERCETMSAGLPEDYLVGLTKPSVDRILKMDAPGDCLALYTFYCYTRKWQKNSAVFATSDFAMTGLGWGRDRFSNAKRQLKEHGFIEDVVRRGEDGRALKWYVGVRFAQSATLANFHTTENPHSGETRDKYLGMVNEIPSNNNQIPPNCNSLTNEEASLNKSSNPPDRQKTTTEQPEGKVMSASAEQKTPPTCDSPPPSIYSADFETFWTAYPRKIGKKAAWNEWRRHKVNLATALKAIEQQRKAGMFKEQQYIIYPQRWINQGRWEEIETAPQLRVNAPVASPNPQAGSSCHRIKSEGLEDAFWNWFQTQRDWEERRNLRTVDDVWLDQFLLTLSEEF
jgi:hypothetical protein